MYLKRLKDLREDKDLFQKELAKVLNITQQYYSEYETGKRSIPIEILIELSNFYDVSCDYILGLTNKKERNK